MKISNRRAYLGRTVFISSSQEMGQMYGRARLMPAEALLRRRVARVVGQQRMATPKEVQPDLRLIEIEIPYRPFFYRLVA